MVLRRTQFVLVLHSVEDLRPAAIVTVEDSSKKVEGPRSIADSCKRIQHRKRRGWEQNTDTAGECD